MYYHICAFVIGYLLDLLIGDPHWMPHPIRLIGNLIHFLDVSLLGQLPLGDNSGRKRDGAKEKRRGFMLVLITLLSVFLVTGGILVLFYRISIYAGMTAEAVMTCYILAAKSLAAESMKVEKKLEEGDPEGARSAVSMIVGRDTENLDEKGIMRAAVETVAENTSDGVIAPLLYTFIGGPVLGFVYKAVNTMDSMVGYHNDRYENFGSCAAGLDDVVNFIPARLSAVLMLAAAFLLGKDYNFKRAAAVFKRDRFKHKSPNSAQTESVCAGALGLRLAGPAFYFGKAVQKPWIGDPVREIEAKDIRRSLKLMFMTEFLALSLCLLIALLADI